MLSQFEREEQGRFSEAAARQEIYAQQRDALRQRQLELALMANRCTTVCNVLVGQEFVDRMAKVDLLIEELCALRAESATPSGHFHRVEEMMASNVALQSEVAELQGRVGKEQAEISILGALVQSRWKLLQKNQQKLGELETQVGKLNIELNLIQDQFQSATNACLRHVQGLSPGEEEMLSLGRFNELLGELTVQINNEIKAESDLLIALTQQYPYLQHLKTEHQSAQKVFSNYSTGSSEQELIREEGELGREIEAVRERIQLQRRREEQARRDCEGAAKREGVRQAREWLGKRVQDLAKKKVAIRAALDVVVPGSAEEELREIQNQLRIIEQDQSVFLEKWNHHEMQRE